MEPTFLHARAELRCKSPRMSLHGTKRTSSDVRYSVVIGKREFAKFTQFTPGHSNALKCAS